MHNVYLPIDNVSQFQCYVVQNSDTVRAYYNTPAHNSSSNYVDFYVNSHYLTSTGSQTWGNTSQLPNCNLNGNITTNYWYSNDFPNALFIFMFIVIFIFVILHILFKPLGRWLHVF